MKMTVSYEWLCDLVKDLDKKTPEQIGLALTSIGAENENTSILDFNCDLAEITDISTLKKLSKINVKTSKGEFVVVSNSQNLEIGQYVIFAPNGSKIFGDIIVSARQIEDIKTEGLLLALENLGIESKSLDIAFLGKDKKIAQELFDAYTKLDAIYTLDVPGNRADWLSVRELARALAIHFDLELKEYYYDLSRNGICDKKIQIQSDRCNRYSLTKISNISPKQTPAHIQKRLYLLGMRPINFLVDMSNFAMLELGQPTHAFDAKK